MIIKKLFFFLFKPPVRYLTALVIAGVVLFAYKNYKALVFPGYLSSVKHQTGDIGGYSTHAAFEKECKHCHAPIHCIMDTHCQDCHMEIAEQRSSNTGLHSMLPGTDRCQSCHPEHRGRDVSVTVFAYNNVDHTALAGFSLVKHQLDYQDKPMNCESCHEQGRYVGESLDCTTCHAQEDHDYVAAHIEEYGSDCVPCHDGVDRMGSYDHAQDYVLDGAHADVACIDCHGEGGFEETPRDCISCHEEPEVHAVVFGIDCSRCHTTEAFTPALLTRHTFSLSHGAEDIHECSTCHVETFSGVSCYGCHDHTEQQMASAHQAEGIPDYADCQSCHPTGRSQEAAQIRNGKPVSEVIRESSSGAEWSAPLEAGSAGFGSSGASQASGAAASTAGSSSPAAGAPPEGAPGNQGPGSTGVPRASTPTESGWHPGDNQSQAAGQGAQSVLGQPKTDTGDNRRGQGSGEGH